MFDRIFVAVDGSEAAAAALREAIELARSVHGSLRLAHIVNGSPWIGPEASGKLFQQLMDGFRGNGESILHEAVTSVRTADIPVDSRLIEAPASEAGPYIIKEASAWPADIIVCGTHGRRGLHRSLMGGDAEYIIQHSAVPVLFVHASAEPPRQ